MRSIILSVALAMVTTGTAASPLPLLPDELIAQAVRTPAPRWKFVNPDRYRELPGTFALQVTAAAAFQSPESMVDGKTLATHLAEKIRYFLVSPSVDADGTTREPEAQGGIGGWSHHVPAHALLLAKRTPAVWEQLSADEHARADLLMEALALAAHFCLDDDNDYYLLLDGFSLFHKSWNPNHTDGYVGVIIAASLYFGPADLNARFLAFDFDSFLARLEAANFQNIKRCWTWSPEIRGLMMHGGPVAVPATQILAQGVVTRGAGVRNTFTLDGITLHEPWAMHRAQAVQLYSKAVRTHVVHSGAVASRLLHRTSTATESPWEGQMGMLHEFESTDWGGLRTSLGYAYEGVMIDIPTATTLKLLGEWRADEGGDMLEKRMGVGMGDLMFKAREGYHSLFNGRSADYGWERDLVPMGGEFIVGLWQTYFAPPPPPSK
ncbi:MAG: hypothetical protein Q8J74_13550 [Candidatus Didemnitutus sp.]|nr:hypothetical protein [Candidatus Didemnitutus sp.]